MNDDLFDIFEDTTKLNLEPQLIKEEPRTIVLDEYFENNTRHEVIFPYKFYKENKNNINQYFIPKIPILDAKKYKFELDTFQNLSISAIEKDQSVLVSAHTSCGKTVVAEYAIAQAIKNNQRVVYTSPIKALSNQKFRELQEEFGDVGLMTGDVTLNPEATCLVMTTEILRNMLYRGSEVIREVHWIIFDEIHYMRDKSRGVVWEETIILLPKHVRMIFLSATIPNAIEFAEWICYVQSQPVNIVYTEKRVIPLIHYFQTDQKYLVKDSKFHTEAFLKSNQNTINKNNLPNILKSTLEQINTPAVIFSFSRKDCEKLATSLNNSDFTSEDEKETVSIIFNNAINSLRKEDREIPVISNMLPLLKRGIGIHHSGLLPIIKEIVEILFQESLIKVLFATETFSIGLNMPAKTVIFTSLTKFDGEKRRLLTSGEYIQMSGRAGRRGLDDKGIVISLITDKLETDSIKEMFSSNSDKLYSAFRLTYNMVLNLMRVEDLDPMYLLSRSFYHFQAYKSAIAQEALLLSEINNINSINNNDDINSINNNDINYNTCINDINYISNNTHNISNTHNVSNDYIVNKLQVLLKERELLLIKRNQSLSSTFINIIKSKGRVVDLLIPNNGCPLLIKNCIVRSFRSLEKDYINCYVQTNNEIILKEFLLEYVYNVYNIRVKVDERVFKKKFEKIEFINEYDLQIESINNEINSLLSNNINDINNMDKCIICNKESIDCLVNCTFVKKNYLLDKAVINLQNEVKSKLINQKIEYLNELREVYHMAECKKMINVLKKLNHLEGNTVLIKGKMASEISSGDELLLTEMIFGTNFTELNLMDMVALLSTTICEESVSDSTVLTEENEKLIEILKISVHKITTVMNECLIEVDEQEYLKRFSFELMDVVKMWMSGHTFVEICASTKVFEGSIIRTFKRLEELLRQLSTAAGVIGNTELMNMFAQGIYLIKRDIVFANSLYL